HFIGSKRVNMLTAQQAIKVMRVLVVDAHEDGAGTIVSKLSSEGYERIFVTQGGEDALRLLSVGLAKHEPINLVLLSLNLPDRPGLEPFNEIHNIFDVEIMLLAQRDDRHLALEGIGRGANDYMLQPT